MHIPLVHVPKLKVFWPEVFFVVAQGINGQRRPTVTHFLSPFHARCLFNKLLALFQLCLNGIVSCCLWVFCFLFLVKKKKNKLIPKKNNSFLVLEWLLLTWLHLSIAPHGRVLCPLVMACKTFTWFGRITHPQQLSCLQVRLSHYPQI